MRRAPGRIQWCVHWSDRVVSGAVDLAGALLHSPATCSGNVGPHAQIRLFPLTREGRSAEPAVAGSLGPSGPEPGCAASPTAASTHTRDRLCKQRPAHAPPPVYLVRIDPLKHTRTVKHFCMLMWATGHTPTTAALTIWTNHDRTTLHASKRARLSPSCQAVLRARKRDICAARGRITLRWAILYRSMGRPHQASSPHCAPR